MKEANNITKISAAVVALVAVVGLSAASFAQSDSSTEISPIKERFAKFQLTDEEREARQVEREARQEAMNEAIQGDYATWVAAVKEQRGEDAPILEQVNEGNYPALQEAHGYKVEARELMEKARVTLEEAGIDMKQGRRGFGHKGFGEHMKGMRGMGR